MPGVGWLIRLCGLDVIELIGQSSSLLKQQQYALEPMCIHNNCTSKLHVPYINKIPVLFITE